MRTKCVALLAVVAALSATAQVIIEPMPPLEPVPAYPRVDVTPARPTVGGSATVWLVKGMHSNGCVPAYQTNYRIVAQAILIYPPVYTVNVTYKEEWPPVGSICPAVTTEYGPRFTLSSLKLGTYQVVDNGVVVGSFQVQEAHSIRGIVVDDPYPSRRMSVPIAGCKVYLQQEMPYYLMDMGATDGLIARPYPMSLVDSTTTDRLGNYSFASVPPSSYHLTFVAAGFASRRVSFYLSTDTTISVMLVPEGAVGTVSGTVTTVECPADPRMDAPCVLQPLPQCTVTVVYADCGRIGPLPMAGSLPGAPLPIDDFMCASFTAVTDRSGAYVVSGIPLSVNRQPMTVTARKFGFVTQTRDTEVSNGMTAQVDFQLERAFQNAASATVDGVVFTIATEKALYNAGEYLRARYTVTNGSMAAVTYNFTSTCQFDLRVVGGATTGEVYSYLRNVGCGDALTRLVLSPGESRQFVFPGVYVDGQNSRLRVSGRMVGYERSEVTVDAGVSGFTAVEPVARATERDNVVTWSSRTATLSMNLGRAQTVATEAYLLDGSRVEALSATRYLEAGMHSFGIDRTRLGSGVVIMRIKGENFSVTKRLGVGR